MRWRPNSCELEMPVARSVGIRLEPLKKGKDESTRNRGREKWKGRR
jgi:hypothetical protein